MKRMTAIVFASAALFVVAMPSQEELDRVAPVVLELMQPEEDALKAGTKTQSQVADAALALVPQAESEAAKLILAKGAFNLYVRDGNFDKAHDALARMRAEVPDLTTQHIANIIESALRHAPRERGGQLYRMLDEMRIRVRYQQELAVLQAQEKAATPSKALELRLAEHYAVLGQWDKALDAFSKSDDVMAALIATREKGGEKDLKTLADFWWSYPKGRAEEFEGPFKRHAAELYEKALASGKITGLYRHQISRRMEEAKSFAGGIYMPLPSRPLVNETRQAAVTKAATPEPPPKTEQVAKPSEKNEEKPKIDTAKGAEVRFETVDGVEWAYTVKNGEACVGGGTKDSPRAIPESMAGVVTIPQKLGGFKVTGIGEYAFLECKALTKAIIPDGVKIIGGSAFALCDNLASVSIPGSVESIEGTSFNTCRALSSIIVPEGVKRIGWGAFQISGLETITLPKSLRTIDNVVFWRCEKLKSVRFLGNAPRVLRGVPINPKDVHKNCVIIVDRNAKGWDDDGGGKWQGIPLRYADRPDVESPKKTPEESAFEKEKRQVEEKIAAQKGDKLYCVVDLSGGPNAMKYPVSYLDSVPKGGWTDEYKTTKLVLRKIDPGSFEYLPGKKFTLTKTYYIGVFEVTQKQYKLVMGNNPAQYKGDTRPVEQVSYEGLRGSDKGLSWPRSDAVDEDAFMGRIRARSGLCLDFPTEVQWEYACRAGQTKCPSPEESSALGRFLDNGGWTHGTATVGSFLPNDFGLYDMYGNVAELCMDYANENEDWTREKVDAAVDWTGPGNGSARRRLRGSCWGHHPVKLWTRQSVLELGASRFDGFRLAIQPPFVPPKKVVHEPLYEFIFTNTISTTANSRRRATMHKDGDIPVRFGDGGKAVFTSSSLYLDTGLPASMATNCTFAVYGTLPKEQTVFGSVGHGASYQCGVMGAYWMESRDGGKYLSVGGVEGFSGYLFYEIGFMGFNVEALGDGPHLYVIRISGKRLDVFVDTVCRDGRDDKRINPASNTTIGFQIGSTFGGNAPGLNRVDANSKSLVYGLWFYDRALDDFEISKLDARCQEQFKPKEIALMESPDPVPAKKDPPDIDDLLDAVLRDLEGDRGETREEVRPTRSTDKQYLVIDLSGGTLASSYPITYLNSVPQGGWTDEYKMTKLVLRKIDGDDVHASFYIGVFEFTQRQWELILGARPSYFCNYLYYWTRPVENVSYEMVRGSFHEVTRDSLLGILRKKTGIRLDLPTEWEYEYAAKAGGTKDTTKGCGKYATKSHWLSFPDKDSDIHQECATTDVGSYKPNAWGLYDMLGNVQEFVREPVDGKCLSVGGSWDRMERDCKSSRSHTFRRDLRDLSYSENTDGFRVVCETVRVQ